MIDMKNNFLLCCLLLLICQVKVFAQTSIRVNVDLVKNTITINDSLFTNNSTIDDYERILGKADRIEQKKGVDQYFAYDKLGISLSLHKDSDVVNEIFITYLYDGDRKIAREVYKGVLIVNQKVVNAQITNIEMSKLANIDLEEVMNGYFITPKRALNLLLYYPQDIKPYTSLKQLALNFAVAN